MPGLSPTNNGRSIQASVGFLRRNAVFVQEEPYAFRFKADIPVPLTNMEYENRDVDIHNLRGQEDVPTLQEWGFEIRQMQSSMAYDDFGSEEIIRSKYLPELKEMLMKHYGAVDVDFARQRVGAYAGTIVNSNSLT